MNIFKPDSSGHWVAKWIILPALAFALATLLSKLTVKALFDTNQKITKNKIVFFGSNTNKYKELATSIEAKLEIAVETNTEGSIDILERVAQTPYSLGICQLDVFKDFPKNSVRLIDTLYNEGLQILYPSKYGDKLVISNNPDKLIDSVFKSSMLYIGKSKSGTNHTAMKFIDALEKCHKIKLDTKKQVNNRHYSAFTDSTIIFFVSGNIDETIKTVLQEEHKGQLFSVGNDFLKSMTDYTITTFKDFNTITTPAILICNKELPQFYIDEIVEFFNNNDFGKKLVTVNHFEDSGSSDLQFKISNSQSSIFLLLLTAYFFTMIAVLKWIGSSFQKSFLFNKVNEIIAENFSEQIKFKKEAFYNGLELFIPEIKRSDREIINTAVNGIENLFELRNQIGIFHNKSLLSKSNYKFLMEIIDNVINKLRKLISIGFSSLIEGNDFLVQRKTLNDFMISEFINRNDYDWLLDKWEKNTIRIGTEQRLISLIDVKVGDNIEGDIIDGRLEEALNRTYNIVKANFELAEGDKFRMEHDLIIHQQGRYNTNKREYGIKRIDYEKYNQELNSIRIALLDIIREAAKSGAIPK